MDWIQAATILKENQNLILAILLIILTSFAIFYLGSQKGTINNNVIDNQNELYDYGLAELLVKLREKKGELKVTTKPWELGISSRSVSFAEQGQLRAIEFTKNMKRPTAEHVVETFAKAVYAPRESELVVQIPQVVVFLDTVIFTEQEKKKVGVLLSALSVKTLTMSSLEEEVPDIAKERLLKMPETPPEGEVDPFANIPDFGPVEKQTPMPFNPAPPRGCIVCKKDIVGKASQCSACKAVIYDSMDCGKKDWATHKMNCKDFKQCVDHISEWNMHDFPFDFYTKDKILHNFNVVPLLTLHSLHNVGLFQRMCGCYSQVGWGAMNARLLQHFQNMRKISPEIMFDTYGLPKEMFALSAPFPPQVDISGLDSWEKYYKTRGYSMNNPAALVLEVPLTIWHLINKHYLSTAAPVPKDERRKLTIHLVGAEKEVDLLPLFEVLLALLPKTEIAIHMIGIAIAPDIPSKQRAMAIKSTQNESSIFMTVTTGLYQPQHLDGSAFKLPDDIPEELAKSQNFGDGPPDLIIAMNAELVVHGEWFPVLSMIAKSGRKLLVTERMEQMCTAAIGNLGKAHAKMSIPTYLNPFRQPVFDFKKDVNIPGFSNGFVFGIN